MTRAWWLHWPYTHTGSPVWATCPSQHYHCAINIIIFHSSLAVQRMIHHCHQLGNEAAKINSDEDLSTRCNQHVISQQMNDVNWNVTVYRHDEDLIKKYKTREHWIQCITFATADTHTAWRRASQYLRSLSGGEGNETQNRREWQEQLIENRQTYVHQVNSRPSVSSNVFQPRNNTRPAQ